MFPFDLDYDAMIALAPNDWGILQLFNSNPWSMKNTWNRYLRVLELLQLTKVRTHLLFFSFLLIMS
jgi:hypothetical protein